MVNDTSCPMCRDGVLLLTEGRLDQCGDSYLPTAVWSCERCGYSRFEPALHARWRSALEPEPTATAPDHHDGLSPVGPKRAA